MFMNSRPTRCRASAAWVIALSLTLCSSGLAKAAPVGPGGASDPFEGVNRAFFAIHQFLDHVLLRPAAMTYRRIMIRPVRTGLANAVSNLGEPAVGINDILQGHGAKAAKTFTRFALNTTVGLVGVLDVAKSGGLRHHDNDFGLTLARYGVKAGPYFFIPLVGPTTLRDGAGAAVGLAFNPLIYARYLGDDAVGATSVVAGGLQARIDADRDLKSLYATATDPYASLRSYYLQNRYATITGKVIDIQALPDFDDEPKTVAPTSPTVPQASAPQAGMSLLGDVQTPEQPSQAGTTVAAPAGSSS